MKLENNKYLDKNLESKASSKLYTNTNKAEKQQSLRSYWATRSKELLDDFLNYFGKKTGW